jgi:hypothetical protein
MAILRALQHIMKVLQWEMLITYNILMYHLLNHCHFLCLALSVLRIMFFYTLKQAIKTITLYIHF